MEICKKELCTGCQLCKVICPKSAIVYKEDLKGFIYPSIDEELCINCGRCRKLCPINVEFGKNNPKQVLAAFVKDKRIKNNSTSGGIFYALASHIIKENGVVFGAAFDSVEVVHTYSTNLEELKKLQGSKYVQSKINDSYKLVKEFLGTGKKVLFSGTPCQIAAIKSFLGKKDYPNLYLVDLVCHGVPNARVFNNYLKEIEQGKTNRVIKEVIFRKKTPDCYTSSMLYIFNKGMAKKISFATDPYSSLFVSNFLIRESCFHCKYSNTSRNSDITLADFWGYKPETFKFRHYMKGINMVMVNTDKGKFLISEIDNNIIKEERTINEAIRGNRNLTAPQEKPNSYEQFWEDYLNNHSLNKLVKKYLPDLKPYPHPIKRYIKSYLKTCLPKPIINIIKNIK